MSISRHSLSSSSFQPPSRKVYIQHSHICHFISNEPPLFYCYIFHIQWNNSFSPSTTSWTKWTKAALPLSYSLYFKIYFQEMKNCHFPVFSDLLTFLSLIEKPPHDLLPSLLTLGLGRNFWFGKYNKDTQVAAIGTSAIDHVSKSFIWEYYLNFNQEFSTSCLYSWVALQFRFHALYWEYGIYSKEENWSGSDCSYFHSRIVVGFWMHSTWTQEPTECEKTL